MKYFITILILICSYVAYGQSKRLVLYNNALTHDKILVNILNSDTTYIYSVSTKAAWTGKLSTKIVYQGNYEDFLSFMIPLLSFAEDNRDNIGATAIIRDIPVKSTKVLGIKCISIGEGDEINNTKYSSIKECVESVFSWKIPKGYHYNKQCSINN